MSLVLITAFHGELTQQRDRIGPVALLRLSLVRSICAALKLA